jgi:hypothetical protein
MAATTTSARQAVIGAGVSVHTQNATYDLLLRQASDVAKAQKIRWYSKNRLLLQ